jgi:hypothetical protein
VWLPRRGWGGHMGQPLHSPDRAKDPMPSGAAPTCPSGIGDNGGPVLIHDVKHRAGAGANN